jgi:apolipoprotein N-acyltransferase
MANPRLRFITGILISFMTSGMLVMAFHPYNLWFFAFVALVPMLVAQHLLLPVRWAGLAPAIGIGGWLFVFLGYMFGTNPTGRVIQIVVLVIIMIDVFTSPGVRRFHLRTGYRYFILFGIADWVGIEMVRSFIPPINTHAFMAQTMYTQPWMLLPMSVFSIYGLSLVIILANFTIARGVMQLMDGRWGLDLTGFFTSRITRRSMATAGGVLAVWIGTSFLIRSNAPSEPPTLKVAAIQHNFTRPGHMDSSQKQQERLDSLSELARDAAIRGASLVVMPELGLGFDPQVEHTRQLQALARETGAFLLIGYGVDSPEGWRNEMVMLTPDGNFLDTYGKNHPTSPGEPRIITAGRYPVYEVLSNPVATLICNDVHYTDVSRKLAKEGARLIAVPTLEGPGIALEQVAQSVMRAVENRVAIVKADVAYASAIIDPYGKIIALRNGAPDGEAFALVADVPLGTGHSLYSRLGDIPGWICLGIFIFFILFQHKVHKDLERKNRQ